MQASNHIAMNRTFSLAVIGGSHIRDAVYWEQLARVASLKAAASEDSDLRIRLREAAIKHERRAREMRQSDASTPPFMVTDSGGSERRPYYRKRAYQKISRSGLLAPYHRF